jgi:hypothetical protein
MSHSFEEKTFGHLTYCDHCKQLLWGLIKQGIHCKGKPKKKSPLRQCDLHNVVYKIVIMFVITNVNH